MYAIMSMDSKDKNRKDADSVAGRLRHMHRQKAEVEVLDLVHGSDLEDVHHRLVVLAAQVVDHLAVHV